MLLWWSLLQRLVLHSSISGPNIIMMIRLWSYYHEHDDHSNINQDENVASSAPGVTLNNIGTHLRPRDSPRLPHRPADHTFLGPPVPRTQDIPPLIWYFTSFAPQKPTISLGLLVGLPRVQGLWQLLHLHHHHHLQGLHDLPPDHWVFCDPIKVDQSAIIALSLVLIMTELHVKDIFWEDFGTFWFWYGGELFVKACLFPQPSPLFSLASSLTTWL